MVDRGKFSWVDHINASSLRGNWTESSNCPLPLYNGSEASVLCSYRWSGSTAGCVTNSTCWAATWWEGLHLLLVFCAFVSRDASNAHQRRRPQLCSSWVQQRNAALVHTILFCSMQCSVSPVDGSADRCGGGRLSDV